MEGVSDLDLRTGLHEDWRLQLCDQRQLIMRRTSAMMVKCRQGSSYGHFSGPRQILFFPESFLQSSWWRRYCWCLFVPRICLLCNGDSCDGVIQWLCAFVGTFRGLFPDSIIGVGMDSKQHSKKVKGHCYVFVVWRHHLCQSVNWSVFWLHVQWQTLIYHVSLKK